MEFMDSEYLGIYDMKVRYAVEGETQNPQDNLMFFVNRGRGDRLVARVDLKELMIYWTNRRNRSEFMYPISNYLTMMRDAA
ncbi:MAG: hypothetical protein LUD47_07885 [Clostridia bacterium]|nr:hypothetical protein [Clostridia bacterium]